MGDNITREKTVAGGEVIDSWIGTITGSAFDITIESLDAGNCDVLIEVLNQNDHPTDPLTFTTVSSGDLLPSGPHRTVTAGILGGTVRLSAVSQGAGDPGTCHVKYTFRWSP